MTVVLRSVLIVVSLVTFLYVIHKIRKAQMKIEGAIFWFVFAGFILVLGIFPQLAFVAADLLGIESTANFIFLMMIFLLIVKCFSLSLANTKLENKLEILTAEIAIWRNEVEKDEE